MTAVEHSSALADVDVFSSDVYVDGVPHEQFARLRAHPGLYRQPIADPQLEDACYVAARYADLVAVAKDGEHFTITDGHNVRKVRGRATDPARNLLVLDDPDHLRLRAMTNRGFTPKVVRRYEAHYRMLAGRILDAALAQPTFDFVTDVAARLPLAAICEILGSPETDEPRIFDWSNRIIGSEDGEYNASPDGRFEAAMEFMGYVDELTRDRLAAPRDDLATLLAQQHQAGELTDAELFGYVMLLFVAGNETTRNNISHGLLALLDHPQQWDALAAAPAEDPLWDTAVEEITRWATPVLYMSRTCTAPVSVAGESLVPGDVVAMFYPSANRDEAVFGPTADRFDITRDPNPHVSFGFSTHFCLGSHLARLETKVMLQELTTRLRGAGVHLEAAGPPQRLRSSFIHGVKHLPVRVR